MSINRDDGEINFECDSCGEAELTALTDFAEARDYAKSYGWKFLKVKEEWHHFCSSICMEEFKSSELDGDFERG